MPLCAAIMPPCAAIMLPCAPYLDDGLSRDPVAPECPRERPSPRASPRGLPLYWDAEELGDGGVDRWLR